MLFTVAVCTWNRSALLEQTLERLTELDARDLDWELVVVNNGSTDETKTIARSLAERLPLRLISEPLVGVSHARNTAVREARGRFIAWTGDDVLVDRGWLRAYADAVTAYGGAAFFGGPIRPRFACEPPEWLTINWRLLASAYSERELGDAAFAFDSPRVPYGPNFVVRTDIQRRYPFDPALGVRGPHRMGGEETTVLRAMLADGHEGWWIPAAAVEHVILHDRLTLGYIRRHFAGLGMLKRRHEGSAHLPGCAPWIWHAAIEAERDYRVSRRTDRPEVWMPKFIAASVARGRVIGPPPYVERPL
jgi:hypothetical protein